MTLHLIDHRFDGNECRVFLSPDQDSIEPEDATAIAHIRIVGDHAPGYFTAAAELWDIDGDPDGVVEWVSKNEERVIRLWQVRTP